MQSDALSVETMNEDLQKLNSSIIKMASFITKSVNNPFRQKIISILLSNNKLAVNELCEKLSTEQSVMSQHLAILRKAGLVTTERQGKSVLYSVNQEKLTAVMDCLLHLTQTSRQVEQNESTRSF